MMERKAKYMPIWGRYVDVFDMLSPVELGTLFHAMLHYHFDGIEPELSGAPAIYWGFLKPDLDHARLSYEKKVENGRKGGQRSGEVRKAKKEAQLSKRKQTEQITITESESRPESITITNTKTNTDISTPPAEAGICVEAKAFGEFGWVKLTDLQYRALQDKMGEQTLQACIRYMDRAAQATGNRHRWRDWQVMLNRCYEEGWYQPVSRGLVQRKTVPMGASGELGEAELEAIRRVLAEDFTPPQ